jgi:hypothetical protein
VITEKRNKTINLCLEILIEKLGSIEYLLAHTIFSEKESCLIEQNVSGLIYDLEEMKLLIKGQRLDGLILKLKSIINNLKPKIILNN